MCNLGGLPLHVISHILSAMSRGRLPPPDWRCKINPAHGKCHWNTYIHTYIHTYIQCSSNMKLDWFHARHNKYCLEISKGYTLDFQLYEFSLYFHNGNKESVKIIWKCDLFSLWMDYLFCTPQNEAAVDGGHKCFQMLSKIFRVRLITSFYTKQTC